MTTERPTRKGFTLRDAGREFWKHPSPWVIGANLDCRADSARRHR